MRSDTINRVQTHRPLSGYRTKSRRRRLEQDIRLEIAVRRMDSLR